MTDKPISLEEVLTRRGARQQDVARDLDEQRRSPEPAPFAIRDIARTFSPPPEQEWIVEPLIPCGEVSTLYGRGGTGKSFLAQLMGTCVASGRAFMNLKTADGRVLILSAEDKAATFWRNQYRINRYLGLRVEDLEGQYFPVETPPGSKLLFLRAPPGSKQALSPTENWSRLCASIEAYQPKLVILDNIARLYGASEIERELVTEFLAELEGVAEAKATAILLLGHPSRNKVDGDAYSGSSAWEAAVRARLEFSKIKQDGDGEGDPNDPVRYVLALCKGNLVSPEKADWKMPLVLDRDTGIVRPDDPAYQSANERRAAARRRQDVEETISRGVEWLWWERGISVSASPNSATRFLPKVLAVHELTNDFPQSELKSAMEHMIMRQDLVETQLGRDAYRKPVVGLATQAMREKLDAAS